MKLDENDVSGGKLPFSDVSENSKFSPKQWFECRGLQTKGNKPELIKRLVLSLLCMFHFTIVLTGLDLLIKTKLYLRIKPNSYKISLLINLFKIFIQKA